MAVNEERCWQNDKKLKKNVITLMLKNDKPLTI